MADNKKTEAEAVNEEVASAETEAPAEAQGSDVPESIGLQDLQLLAQIVDLASQRVGSAARRPQRAPRCQSSPCPAHKRRHSLRSDQQERQRSTAYHGQRT